MEGQQRRRPLAWRVGDGIPGVLTRLVEIRSVGTDSPASPINVLLVDDITNEPAIVRDLALIKVGAKHEARSHVLELASVFRARVVDVAPESLTIEITGAEDKIDGLLEVLKPYGLLEVVRTGIVAMRRGAKVSTALPKVNGASVIANDENVSYSV